MTRFTKTTPDPKVESPLFALIEDRPDQGLIVFGVANAENVHEVLNDIKTDPGRAGWPRAYARPVRLQFID
jgi:hypothetical protein